MKHKVTFVTKRGQQFSTTVETENLPNYQKDFEFEVKTLIRPENNDEPLILLAPGCVEAIVIAPAPPKKVGK